jgi:hypothetical protein
MPIVAPPPITPLPQAPDPNDRATFNARAYPWAAAQAVLATEVGAVAANVANNAMEAAALASAADASALSAASDADDAAASAAAAAGYLAVLPPGTLNDGIFTLLNSWSAVKVRAVMRTTEIVPVAALDIDCELGNYFTKTINGNSTFTFSNAPSGAAFAFTLELSHVSGTVVWPASVKWPAGQAPILPPGAVSVMTFLTDDGGARWRGMANTGYEV